MSIIHLFGKSRARGSLVLPRHQAGQINWPRCWICKRIVDAYGIENETDASIEVWAKCTGVLQDPQTGLSVGFSTRKHPEMKSSVTILKGPGWSPQRLTDIIARQAFFAPPGEGERQFLQTLSPDGVGRRWGAG